MGFIPEGHTLFVIDIEYTVEMEAVAPHLDAHMAFVAKGYEDGLFLASGAKVPRTGGVIIAQGASRSAVEALVADDPFSKAGIVQVTITEFVGRNLADVLK
ncbi:MAG: YciI family protein [Pseudomonadota bacterium]|jgi:uncharacterized protein YciI|uniref:YciI family protein n=1 Tax=Thalassovita sp. TaxID=1979401 RepID=UPI002AAF7962|nr:YciI family protein [Thalassovita sp.]MEC7963466.1 YciI family protein [Pseudomonadota bacterium]MEC8293330.1 YciI family protein [Pseudomonadota bacterium]